MTIRPFNIRAMTMPKQRFVNKISNFIGGAYGEFICRQLAVELKLFPDHWTKEVNSILKKGNELMGPDTLVAVKRKDDCFKEAVKDELTALVLYVRQSRNKVWEYYPKLVRKIDAVPLDPSEQMILMFKEFLPEYLPLLEQVLAGKKP